MRSWVWIWRFFICNRGLLLSIRPIFYPILGDRIYGFWNKVIEVLSVFTALVGLATSLGLGVTQINAGLHFLFGVQISPELSEWIETL